MSEFRRMGVKKIPKMLPSLMKMSPTNPEILMNTKQDKDQPLPTYLVIKLLRNLKKRKETSWGIGVHPH